jgi:hypothetical protein
MLTDLSFGSSMKTENITAENPITGMIHVENSVILGCASLPLLLTLL